MDAEQALGLYYRWDYRGWNKVARVRVGLAPARGRVDAEQVRRFVDRYARALTRALTRALARA